jgi:hypothetical protein
MKTRESIDNFRIGLTIGSVSICGDAPKWIRDELLVRINKLLEESNDSSLKVNTENFSLGAIRFVADNCGSECDQLVESLSSLG